MTKYIESVINFFKENYIAMINFVLALIVLSIIAIFLLKLFKWVLKKNGVEQMTSRFALMITRFVLFLIVILVSLSIAGVEVTGLTTAISAILLAIGMALKDSIAHVANGLIIVSSKKFKQGDYISVDGVEGNIEDINFIFMTLKTPDGKRITMPNSTILNNPTTNHYVYPYRRINLEINVAYETDIDLAKKVILDSVKSCGLVRLDPAPSCNLKTFNDSSITLFTMVYVDSSDYWTAYYQVTDVIFNELKRHNISIPYQQIEIRERTDKVVMPVRGEGLSQRIEKERHEEKKRKITFDNIEDISFKDIVPKKKKKAKKAPSKEEKK